MSSFLQKISQKQIILLGLAFSLLNVVFVVAEVYWALLLPFALALIVAIVLALDKVLLFLVFSTPLSIFYFDPQLHVGFNLPTEPIIFGVSVFFVFKLLFEGGFDRSFVRHPLTIVILLNLLWMVVTAISSDLLLISAKYVLVRTWFLIVFYFLMSQLFKKRNYITLFFWLFLISLSITVVYTLYVHSQHGFTKQSGNWVMFPFFKEHTIYGAVLALYIPISFVLAFVHKQGVNLRMFASTIFVILIVGVIFSFTRAAWVGLAVAFGAMFLIILKTRREFIYLLAIAFLGLGYFMKDDLIQRFEKNESVSSDNFTEHIESIANISTDASNLERINRWKSAYRMFKEKPVLGFGPGTYMFLYAPYQKPHEKTIISTNAGDLGNAHSEYIGPLAESGLPGLITVLLIVVFTLRTGIRAYYRLEDKQLKAVALATLMGLITYWTHGFLNNFLDIDKAACPVLGFTALLVILDIYYTPSRTIGNNTVEKEQQ